MAKPPEDKKNRIRKPAHEKKSTSGREAWEQRKRERNAAKQQAWQGGQGYTNLTCEQTLDRWAKEDNR